MGGNPCASTESDAHERQTQREPLVRGSHQAREPAAPQALAGRHIANRRDGFIQID